MHEDSSTLSTDSSRGDAYADADVAGAEVTPANDDTAVAVRFTFSMNAATSRYGVLCDISWVFVVVAGMGVALAGVYTAVPLMPAWVALVVLAIPVVVSVGAHVGLRNARDAVVTWVRRVPFAFINVNGVLSGTGEVFELRFRGALAPRDVVMSHLAQASPDCFVLEVDEDERLVTCRLGVVTRRFNPLGEAYERYERMRRVCDEALVALHREHPIDSVRFL